MSRASKEPREREPLLSPGLAIVTIAGLMVLLWAVPTAWDFLHGEWAPGQD